MGRARRDISATACESFNSILGERRGLRLGQASPSTADPFNQLMERFLATRPSEDKMRVINLLHELAQQEPERDGWPAYRIAEQLGETNHYRVAAWLKNLKKAGFVGDSKEAFGTSRQWRLNLPCKLG